MWLAITRFPGDYGCAFTGLDCGGVWGRPIDRLARDAGFAGSARIRARLSLGTCSLRCRANGSTGMRFWVRPGQRRRRGNRGSRPEPWGQPAQLRPDRRRGHSPGPGPSGGPLPPGILHPGRGRSRFQRQDDDHKPAGVGARAEVSDAPKRGGGSFNNEIGVPLTLLGLETAHQAAVLEAGTTRVSWPPLLDHLAASGGADLDGREHLEFFGALPRRGPRGRLARPDDAGRGDLSLPTAIARGPASSPGGDRRGR